MFGAMGGEGLEMTTGHSALCDCPEPSSLERMSPSRLKPNHSLIWLIIPLLLVVLVLCWEVASKGSAETKSSSEAAGFEAPGRNEAQGGNEAFSAWAHQYELAAEDERSDFLERGIAMARERRAWLAELIQSDPEAASPRADPRRRCHRRESPAPTLQEILAT